MKGRDGSRRFATFDEFFPYYVAMHSKAATRQVHFAGTLAGAVLALYGLATRRFRLLAAFPLLGYGAAWPSHFLIERNNPATFGYPGWSLRGDFRMIWLMLQGRDAELGKIAQEWLAKNAGTPEKAEKWENTA